MSGIVNLKSNIQGTSNQILALIFNERSPLYYTDMFFLTLKAINKHIIKHILTRVLKLHLKTLSTR